MKRSILYGILFFYLLPFTTAQMFYLGEGLPECKKVGSNDCLLRNAIEESATELANYHTDKAEAILRNAKKQLTDTSGQILSPWYVAMSEISSGKLAFEQALTYLDRAFELGFADSLWYGHANLLKVYPIVAINTHNPLGAEEALFEAERIYNYYLPNSKLIKARLFIDRGRFFRKINMPDAGKPYFEQAYRLLSQTNFAESLPQRINTMLGIGASYKNNPDSAFYWLDKAESLLPSHAELKKDGIRIIKGKLCLRSKLPQAFELLNPIRLKYRDNPQKYSVLLTGTYESLILYYIDITRESQKALEIIDEALSVLPDKPEFSGIRSTIFYDLSVYYLSHEVIPDSSLKYSLLAHQYNSIGWTPDQSLFPSTSQIINWPKWLFIQGLQMTGYFYKFEFYKDSLDSRKAYRCMQGFYQYLPYHLGETPQQALPEILNLVSDRLSSINRIETDKKLHISKRDFFRGVFFSAEYLRSIYFRTYAQQKKAIAQLSDTLQMELDKVQTMKVRTKRQVLIDEGQKGNLNQQLFHLEHREDSLLRIAKSKYPGFDKLNHELDTVNIRDLQKFLEKENQAIISYHYAKDEIQNLLKRTFLITADTLITFINPVNANLDSLVNQWHTQIVKRSTPEQSGTLADLSYQLYKVLLEPVEKAYSKNLPERIMVIPFHSIELLPFDLLLTENPQVNAPFKDWPFAFKKYAFSYGYSADLWFKAQQKYSKKNHKSQALIMTPKYQKSDSSGNPPITLRKGSRGFLEDLKNDEEGKLIAKMLPKSFWLNDDEARREVFLKHAPQSRFIHIAGHGNTDILNPNLSNLSFTNPTDYGKGEKCFLPEIYGLNLIAEMAVLSACETGLGAIKPGEGIASLSRAFRTVGAQAVVSSLWQVPNKDTKKTMTEFYTNLKKGYSKDQALRAAKMYMLENQKNRSHPFYWGAFVIYGNNQPVILNTNQWVWPLTGVVMILFGLVFIFFNQRKKLV